MKKNILTPKQALNKAYQKVTVHRKDFDLFKKSLSNLLMNIDLKESEDNNKSHLKDFLDETYFKGKHLINVKNNTDLVIYLENKQESKSGVLFEVKRPGNKSEMVSKTNLNAKAFQELILYYLNERTVNKNDEIKYLIATNIFEWFIFDAVLFENLFYKNKDFLKEYDLWKNDLKVSSNTDHFYNEIAKPYITQIKEEISYTNFNLNDFKKFLDKTDKESEKKLIPLYKILSPVHLLKQPFANDSNSLDKNFYNELLHLIGLEEVKDKNKKIIRRKEKEKRNNGSILENAIQILITENALNKITDIQKYGSSKEEQYFNVALELTLTWINRILFLKLLESQLYDYNKSDAYKFLNGKTIKDYDELYKLFHQVLAVKIKERNREINKKFGLVPYLNSSLFEISELENVTIKINSLDASALIDIFHSTVLKENGGRKKTGQFLTLHYLFEFLDAYNFTSEGKEDIEDEKKTLINASVLGLIFEKINGYKDGSYFTPGFITMYMSRESIQRAVIQKFNERYDWECDSIDDLHNHLTDRRKTKDIVEANSVINSLKICDPAVGSGHFLVSCLNEIIGIKSAIGILADENGKLLKGYDARVENDELIISFDEGEEIFEYITPHKSGTKTETQRVQETLFREKQTIIENCLFGVDINPNSVSIARLRLWIELLKNSYYTIESNYTELETLPNIDINIKEGNSLVSRFETTKDLFTGADRTAFEVYRLNVSQYKNEHDRDKRRQLKSSIDKTKDRIKGIAINPVKELDIKITDLTVKHHDLNKTDMFEDQKSKAEKEKIEKKKHDLSLKLDQLIIERRKKVEEYNLLYSNAFEWRFEFPEVLDENGKFNGFDVVIGNPPYGIYNKKQNQNVALEVDESLLEIIKNRFPAAVEGMVNAAKVFYLMAFDLISINGFNIMIIPFGFLTDTSSKNLRAHIFSNHSLIRVDAFPERDSTTRRIFEDVKMSTSIILSKKQSQETKINLGVSFERRIEENERVMLSYIDLKIINSELLSIPLCNQKQFDLMKKIYSNDSTKRLKNYCNCLTGEVDISFGKKAITSNKNKARLIKGVQIDKYVIKSTNEEISQGEIEYLDEEKFKLIYNGPKIDHVNHKRIILQGLTGVNEKIRIKASLLTEKAYLANSANYLIPNNDSMRKYILGLLNSNVVNFCFKCLSTSSNVNGYEVDELPIRLGTYDETIIEAVSKIVQKKKANPNADTSKLESEVDKIFYRLYGLTEEEVKIIEGDTNTI